MHSFRCDGQYLKTKILSNFHPFFLNYFNMSMASTLALESVQRQTSPSDLIICGILYKWVNYGKGWRARWFVLQDGVLSFFKIHGPDKIVVNQETEKGSRVIGEESMKLMFCNHKNGSHSSSKTWKAVGEIHLKVSSIRESKSDDKGFSIYTGTKRLHLRAECREDRMAWIEALQAVKDKFPRISNSELMAPVDNLAVSTEKMRQRLLEEGLNEVAIQESEQIMKDEFMSMRNQLLLLKQKQCLLMDTVRQLEVHVVIRRITLGSQNSSSVSSLNNSARQSSISLP
ncbi:Hypothetical predicted protein [Olea europaea subsp. europaea]|uniref:PH domain-containing protein n=2 Tax=Olea europaea subsp. europaea TaxID=158383 RepID=A0A8S0TF69_OLEEU|nr:Hypothetical predicted protein [Olea europaea subsp. europaea]